jgi:ABC-2 type transport system ATP-binding protein
VPDAVVADAVTKRFRVRSSRSIRNMIIRRMRGEAASDTFPAINNVSFAVEEGEAVGLMGLNGSGKSTLLKMVSGVMRPDQGEVLVRGRIAGLIEVGAGLHPDLTGRENIYLNGAILGMRQVEIDRKFDAIVDFSGVERFIDNEVRHYSSGMFARLGFSVAVHTEPDVFLVDEVLSVGDQPFPQEVPAAHPGSPRRWPDADHREPQRPPVRRLCNRGAGAAGRAGSCSTGRRSRRRSCSRPARTTMTTTCEARPHANPYGAVGWWRRRCAVRAGPRSPRRGDDLRQPTAGAPAQRVGYAGDVGDQRRRVTGTPLDRFRRYVVSGCTADLGQHLVHRGALTRADVEHVVAPLVSVEVVQRRQVRLSKVEHMHVVATQVPSAVG